MSMNEVLTLALRLTEPERATLAQQLLLSLAPPGEDVAGEQDWQVACMDEVRRRVERLDSGETTAQDWRAALEEIRSRLQRSAFSEPR